MSEPAPAPAPAPAPEPLWHADVDPEIKGHWENKGLKLDSAKDIAVAMTKQHREAERHFGVPADRLLKIPAPDAKPDEVATFYQRLGAPKEAKEYDLSAIKMGGNDLDPALSDAIREALAAAYVPKDKAGAAAARIVKQLEDAESAKATIAQGKYAEERAALEKNWGPKFQFNHLQAMEGARKAGITPEAVKAMEGQVGYAAVMEHFRRLGAGMSESAYHEGSGGTGPTTRDGAIARLAELEGDKAFGKRLTSGDAAAKAEWASLTLQAAGEAA